MQHPALKIVVIGPESTGKSVLCQELSAHYNALWCPEYARTYLEENDMDGHYTDKDLLLIARGQLAAEDEVFREACQRRDRLLLIDTDMYVMKIWSEFAFQRCHHWILEQIAKRHYDYYLLCDIDLPWAPDPLREYPDPAMRQNLFNHYLDLLIHQHTPFGIIKGEGIQRLHHAIVQLDREILFDKDKYATEP